jgi:hypothetical protein
MSAAYDLDEDRTEEPEGGSPQVFHRIFTVPAGAPWEQGRAAQLEARLGSPLPISELSWRARRLASWAPGRPGRYVVFYIRTRELSGPFETAMEVEGQTLRVAFGSPGRQLKRAGGVAVSAIAAAGLAACVAAGVLIAVNVRVQAADQLGVLERAADLKARQVAILQGRFAAERELKGAVAKSGRFEDVLADLAWATDAKAPDARIVAFHWDHRLMAVEARGDAPPFLASDRVVERAAKPLRPGVWLWAARRGERPQPEAAAP